MKSLAFISILCVSSCQLPFHKEIDHKALEIAKLQTRIDSLFNDHIGVNEPGAAVLVSYDGQMIVGKGYGLRDLDKGEPITENTIMNIASVSKQFTALCILSLVDEGKLDLYDEVYAYFPYPIFKNISIMQLIVHTSGLPEYLDYFRKYWDPEHMVNNQDVLNWLATSPEPHFTPGQRQEYCNTAYLVLAQIVEKVSGKEFSEYARENVFLKAGMRNTHFVNLAHPKAIPEQAKRYEIDSLNRFNKVEINCLDGVMGDGGMYTSVEDYFRYDLALRNKSIVSDKSHRLIFKPRARVENNEGDEAYSAMGWFVSDTTAVHTGNWYGVNTFAKRYLNMPLTIAIFMNRNTLFTSDLIDKSDSLAYTHVLNIR